MITEQVVREPAPPSPSSTNRVGRLQLAVIGAVVILAAGIGLVLGLTDPRRAWTERARCPRPRMSLPTRSCTWRHASTCRRDSASPCEPSSSDSRQSMPTTCWVPPWRPRWTTLLRYEQCAIRPTRATSRRGSTAGLRSACSTSRSQPIQQRPTRCRSAAVHGGLVGVRDATAAGAFADTLRGELLEMGTSFVSSELPGHHHLDARPGHDHHTRADGRRWLRLRTDR